MARLLILSLRESGYEGEILVVTNQLEGLFRHGRYNVREVFVDTDDLPAQALGVAAKEWKFRIAPLINNTEYDQIFYIDCDCLALGNPVIRLASEKEVSCAVESWGKISDDPFRAYLTEQEMETLKSSPINSGIFRMSASALPRLLKRWEEIYVSPRVRPSICVDQPAWVRLILDEGDKAERWKASDLIRYPLAEPMHVNAYKHAVLLHYCGMQGEERLDHMIADYLRLFNPKCLNAMADLLAF